MKIKDNNHGFSAIGVLIIVGVIGIIGLVSYNVYSKQQAKSETPTSTQANANETPAADSEAAPQVTKTEDLTTAEKSIDSVNVDSTTDETQLNSDLAF